MKGIVFSELMQMVEEKFSFDIADQMIENCNLASGGSYTRVGNYDHVEVLQLVTELSKITGTPVADLVFAFGNHLAGRFSRLYPQFFSDAPSTFDFLESVDRHIHVAVLKL